MSIYELCARSKEKQYCIVVMGIVLGEQECRYMNDVSEMSD